MAGSATTNFHLHSDTNCIVQINEAKISTATSTTTQSPDTIMSTRQATFALFAAVLLNSLQLKYQGNDQSPFETHPKTMFAAITSLFIYCISYEEKLRNSFFAKLSIALLGPLSLALLSTVLFPQSISLLLYPLFILYSLSQLPRSQLKRKWIYLRAIIMDGFNHQPQQQGRQSGRGLVSVQLPWLPEEHAFLDQVDVLPPV